MEKNNLFPAATGGTTGHSQMGDREAYLLGLDMLDCEGRRMDLIRTAMPIEGLLQPLDWHTDLLSLECDLSYTHSFGSIPQGDGDRFLLLIRFAPIGKYINMQNHGASC